MAKEEKKYLVNRIVNEGEMTTTFCPWSKEKSNPTFSIVVVCRSAKTTNKGEKSLASQKVLAMLLPSTSTSEIRGNNNGYHISLVERKKLFSRRTLSVSNLDIFLLFRLVKRRLKSCQFIVCMVYDFSVLFFS